MFAKGFDLKPVLRTAVFVAVGVALSACAATYRKHGYVPSPDQLAEVVPGIDTRDSVAETIGVPSSTGVLNDSGYYYVATRFRHYGAAAPKPVWKVLRLAPGTTPGVAQAWAERYAGCTLVVDAGVPGEYGGTGQAADWQAAAVLASHRRVVLAGGLRADNVGAAIEQVRPWAVDVSSGVEAEPGAKDESELKAFARALERYR